MELLRTTVSFLTGFAIIIAIVNLYFKVNKIWKRKHEKEVAESQSIVALGSEILLYLLWGTSYLLNSDWNSLADNAIGMSESFFFLIIGSGMFVAGTRMSKKSFWQMIKEAIKIERKEAKYLFNLISGKGQAEKIIKILKELAWIDDDFDKKEIELVKSFAQNWNIYLKDNDFLINPHSNDSSSNDKLNDRFVKIKSSLNEFLQEKPEKQQINELNQLFHDLISADGKIEKNEDIIIGELNGILLEYLGEAVPIFQVLTFPQEEKHRILIENILKELNPGIDINSKEKKIDGGYGFIMHECYSQMYAELLADEERNNHGLLTVIKESIRK